MSGGLLEKSKQGKIPTVEEVNTWWSQMPCLIPEYEIVVSKLKPILYQLPPKIIAIDGPNGVGKTKLGRYLSCVFNSSLIETDLFSARPGFEHDYDQIKKIINKRLTRNRPVFVEGVTVLQILDLVGVKPDYHIYWENVHHSDSSIDRADRLGVALRRYCEKYKPKQNADLAIAASIDICPVLSGLQSKPEA